jgi:hypothetical protein
MKSFRRTSKAVSQRQADPTGDESIASEYEIQFLSDPSTSENIVAGQPFATAPVVHLVSSRDQTPVKGPHASSIVKLTINSGPQDKLQGTTKVEMVSAIGDFGNAGLHLFKVGAYSLKAEVEIVDIDKGGTVTKRYVRKESRVFQVKVGAPAEIKFNTQPLVLPQGLTVSDMQKNRPHLRTGVMLMTTMYDVGKFPPPIM